MATEGTLLERFARFLFNSLKGEGKRLEKLPCIECGRPALKGSNQLDTSSLCGECRAEEERRKPTAILPFVERMGEGDCSTLVSFFQLNERLRQRGSGAGFGLRLIDPPEHSGLYITPDNSISFARGGSDGVHSAF